MVKDARNYRDEDEKQKQRNSAQNALESYCFNMKSSVEDSKLKVNISDYDKNTVLDKCNEVFSWLDANQLAEKEKFEFQQKDLESVCNPIITKMYQGAGGAAGWVYGESPSAGGPTPDNGETPGTERWDLKHKKPSDTDYGGTGDIQGGKQLYIAHVRNIALSLSLSLGLSQRVEAKHGIFICFDLH
jgi:hypothetical protein